MWVDDAMCGLAGQVRIGGKETSRELVQSMIDLLSHRGPDHQEIRQFGPSICLGHARLSLLDLTSNGHQPFFNDDYALVYNGEIYNFLEIRKGLAERHGINFKSESDTEVLFYSLILDGIDKTLVSLEGMFTFCFVNIRKSEVYLARDRLGIKPLFYWHEDDTLTFSSELKALVIPHTPPTNYHRVLSSLWGHAERNRHHTMFEGIKQVVPGTYLAFSSTKQLCEKVWFQISDLVDPEYYSYLDKQTASEVKVSFRDIFSDSVARMLTADASIGAFVSGGVDSSLIALSAKSRGKDPLIYSVNVIGRYSEIEHARKLADTLEAPLKVYDFPREKFISDWVRTTWFNDAPITINPHALPFGNLTRLARDGGEKAVLTGEGADELFLGYPIHVRAAFNHAILAPWRWVDMLYERIPGLEPQIRKRKRIVNEELHDIQDQYADRSDQVSISSALSKLPRKERALQNLSLNLMRTTLHALLWRNDRMGMMNSIESRFPFLDEKILRFSANLPVRYKVHRSIKLNDIRHPFHVSKYIVRSALESSLDNRLIKRPKLAFPVHHQNEIRYDPNFFKNGFWQEFAGLGDGQVDYMCAHTDRHLLGNLASLEIWGRLFVHRTDQETLRQHVEANCSFATAAGG